MVITNIGCVQDIPTNTVNPFEDDLTGMFYRKYVIYNLFLNSYRP